MEDRLTPELLLRAYSAGVFPMSQGREDPNVYWVDPKRRGILPMEGFHLSRSLKRSILQRPYEITLDMDFEGVVRGCADREETWINDDIFRAYFGLHRMGYAHSIEAWDGDQLVGGVYGVALGRAFFGESMFSTASDASKIALATLLAHLGQVGFILFDTQFLTDHLASLGAVEINRAQYKRRLESALSDGAAEVMRQPLPDPQSVVHWLTQTS